MASGGDERMIDWMKYAEIQTLKRKGFKKARVAKMTARCPQVYPMWGNSPYEIRLRFPAALYIENSIPCR